MRTAAGPVTAPAIGLRLVKSKETDKPFLALLEADLAAQPAEAVRPLPSRLVNRLETLATGEER